MTRWSRTLCILLILLCEKALGMGLRSFVALPLEQGGIILRLQDLENLSNNTNIAIANVAYGLTGKQTLLLGIPYRLSPSGSNRSGDLSVLYRHIVWQRDKPDGTNRMGLLVGGLIPTTRISNGGKQVGFVATFYQGRREVDFDGVWLQGFGKSPNRALYDISYQYRLTPAEYPEEGLSSQWNIVFEYNGRWLEKHNLLHQITMGLQWIHPTWVIEGGIIQTMNSARDTQIIISTRFHT